MLKLLTFPSTVRDLRRFALIIGTVLGGIGAWTFIRRSSFPAWIVYVDLSLLVLGVAAPKLLSPFYRLWMNFGHVLGWINTRLILGAMFFLVITPVGLFRRLMGYQTLMLSKDTDSASYALPSKERDRQHFRWQF